MRLIVRTLSELCITVGTLIVLFVAYVLFWTGVRADGAMNDQIDQLHKQWSTGSVPAATTTTAPADPAAAPPPPPPAPYHYGKPFAIMYIPRLGFTWNKPVLEGTGRDVLAKGLAHYGGTARLGQVGNFAWPGTGAPTAIRSRTSPGCGPVTRWCSPTEPPGSRIGSTKGPTKPSRPTSASSTLCHGSPVTRVRAAI